jgi:diguanylate cyclase (GGDEF)-like protein
MVQSDLLRLGRNNVLEIFPEALNAGVGVAVLYLAFRFTNDLSFVYQRRAVRFLLAAVAALVVLELLRVLNVLFLDSAVSPGAEETVQEVAETLVIVFAGVAAYFLYRSDRGELSRLSHSAHTDALTGLSNTRFFSRAAPRRFAQAKEQGFPLACVMLDVDDFKNYNDKFGHEAGNEALRCVARTIEQSVRADDLASRYGGEEFVLLLGGGDNEAAVVAERIRSTVEASCSPTREASLFRQLTVSAGVASLTQEMETLDDLIKEADGAMYRVKSTGKNDVFFSNQSK